MAVRRVPKVCVRMSESAIVKTLPCPRRSWATQRSVTIAFEGRSEQERRHDFRPGPPSVRHAMPIGTPNSALATGWAQRRRPGRIRKESKEAAVHSAGAEMQIETTLLANDVHGGRSVKIGSRLRGLRRVGGQC